MKLAPRTRPIFQALLGLAALTLTLAVALPGAVAATPASPASSTAEPRQQRTSGWPMLSDEQIDLIRVYEVHLDGEGRDRPRISIPRKTLTDFLEKYREDDRIPRGRSAQRAFLRADGVDQLKLLFDLRAREFYKDVRIRSQIEPLRTWSSKLHDRLILGYFRDHFGDGVIPSLLLLPQGRDESRVAMTNFYILTQTTVDGKPLIDRNNPSESLLVQWALPRADAKFAAPEDIENWQPYFRGPDDERYTELVDWIKSLIRVNQGNDYGLEFKLPAQIKAEQQNRGS